MSKTLGNKFLTIVLLIFACFLNSAYSQEFNGEMVSRDQLRESGIHANEDLWVRFDSYSRENYLRFVERLTNLKTSKFENEWEGSYSEGWGPSLGYTVFQLDLNKGFAHYYVYTCFPELRSFRFGKVINNEDSIELVTEYSTGSGNPKTERFIKVKWADRLYLVNENALPFFAEKAVGIYVPDDPENEVYPGKWANYWVQGDPDAKVDGFPQYPPKYKKFERQPIKAKLTTVSNRTLTGVETGEGMVSYYMANYPVTIDAGRNKNVRVGMTFYLPELDEEIEITAVYRDKAIGKIVRETDDSSNDECKNSEREIVACRPIAKGMTAQTKVEAMY